jgi:hypothetical protein
MLFHALGDDLGDKMFAILIEYESRKSIRFRPNQPSGRSLFSARDRCTESFPNIRWIKTTDILPKSSPSHPGAFPVKSCSQQFSFGSTTHYRLAAPLLVGCIGNLMT